MENMEKMAIGMFSVINRSRLNSAPFHCERSIANYLSRILGQPERNLETRMYRQWLYVTFWKHDLKAGNSRGGSVLSRNRPIKKN